MKISKALKQCYDLQDLLLKAANDTQCSKGDLAKLAGAWEKLEGRKRILRGRPLPGSLKPVAKQPSDKRKFSASIVAIKPTQPAVGEQPLAVVA